MIKNPDNKLYAQEQSDIPTVTNDFECLDINALVKGIGRKATDNELINYLSKGVHAELIQLENAFSKYS